MKHNLAAVQTTFYPILSHLQIVQFNVKQDQNEQRCEPW